MKVLVNQEQDQVPLTEEQLAALKGAVLRCLEQAGLDDPLEVSVTLVDNPSIKALNRQYRDLDEPTDVLSFPLETPQSIKSLQARGELLLLGDIVISVEKCQQQARTFGHSLRRELAYLAVHGALHLLGYDDQDKPGAQEMARLGEQVMQAEGISR